MNKKKNWDLFQASILIVAVSIDGTSIKSFHIKPSEQVANFEIRVDINPKIKIIIWN